MGCGMLRKRHELRSEEEEAAAGEGLAEGMLQRTMSEVVRVSETGTVSDDEEGEADDEEGEADECDTTPGQAQRKRARMMTTNPKMCKYLSFETFMMFFY